MLMIGDLARLTGTKVNTVRFYEAGGLLPEPGRTASGRRTYAQADVDRLRFIRRTRHLGFSLDEVRALLDMAGQRDRDCGTVDAIATRHLEEIDRKIADLTALRRELSGVIASCAGGTMAECRILEAFSPVDHSALLPQELGHADVRAIRDAVVPASARELDHLME